MISPEDLDTSMGRRLDIRNDAYLPAARFPDRSYLHPFRHAAVGTGDRWADHTDFPSKKSAATRNAWEGVSPQQYFMNPSHSARTYQHPVPNGYPSVVKYESSSLNLSSLTFIPSSNPASLPTSRPTNMRCRIPTARIPCACTLAEPEGEAMLQESPCRARQRRCGPPQSGPDRTT